MRDTPDTKVKEKPQQAAELKTPTKEQAGAASTAAPVETAHQAIVAVNAPLADGAASGGGPDPQASTPAAPQNPLVIPVAIRVTGPARGRWRIGRRFGLDPVDIPVDDLSEDDAAALAADPLLTITAAPVFSVGA